MDKRTLFHESFPEGYFLDTDLISLDAYLKKRNWLKEEETIKEVGIPGAGNMNFVLRIRLDNRSFIIKQSRPWVEKFPQIPAPAKRISVEAAFFKVANQIAEIKEFVPNVIGFDEENSILLTEDLGDTADFLYLYARKKAIEVKELSKLVDFLNHLHNWDAKRIQYPLNQGMRELNWTHIFQFPFEIENGFDLNTVQEGLQEIALTYKTDEPLKQLINKVGADYFKNWPFIITW